ncbi:putative EF-hand domain-containing protein [Pararobbsia alpina]|uniref:caspase family protein n=1 Tax=Pararobbsia alpina TaxID=621374 RepID=UPI0039A5C6C7
MAGLQLNRNRTLAALALAAGISLPAAAWGQIESAVADQPYLAIDAGTHTAGLNSVAVDEASKLVASAADDRTVRIWSASDGRLLSTINLPAGALRTGTPYAVAFQPRTELLAIGGFTSEAAGFPIYLLNPGNSSVVAVIKGVGDATTRLAFSADGRYLAAGTQGLHVFDGTKNWAEVFHDDSYSEVVYALHFSSQGNLLVATIDGQLRLYGPTWNVLAQRTWDWNQQLPTAVFRPDGQVIAVPNPHTRKVDFLDARTLADLPEGGRLNGGDVRDFAWSRDGSRLFAATGLSATLAGVGDKVLACDNGGHSDCVDQARASGQVTAMAALIDGLIVGGAARPFLEARSLAGATQWVHRSSLADNQNFYPLISTSANGQIITFRFEAGGRFLSFNAAQPATPVEVNTEQIPYEGNQLSGLGDDLHHPVFKGHALAIEGQETLLTRYITNNESRVYLGTSQEIYAYAGTGQRLWRREMPDSVRSVLPSQDGRLLIAALADSSIRWYDARTGDEICALMTYASGGTAQMGGGTATDHLGWVLWTPAGYYAASDEAVDVLQWRVNHGAEALASSVPVSSISIMHRPDVFAPLLQSLDIRSALGAADLATAKAAVQVATNAKIQPGARLHVIAIGIKDYGPKAARLMLKFADKDASDFASALDLTQSTSPGSQQGFYAAVMPMLLTNQYATVGGIDQAFETTAQSMEQGHGQDVAVVMFSGHGFPVGGSLYLMPYGVDASNPARIEDTAIPLAQFRNLIGKLAANGQVVVFIDACHSGAAADGTPLAPNATGFSAITPDARTVVVTSSTGAETSYEDSAWQHGAFTKVLLTALDPTASGLHPVSMAELVAFARPQLFSLSKGRQHLGYYMQFPMADRKLLVAAPR